MAKNEELELKDFCKNSELRPSEIAGIVESALIFFLKGGNSSSFKDFLTSVTHASYVFIDMGRILFYSQKKSYGVALLRLNAKCDPL